MYDSMGTESQVKYLNKGILESFNKRLREHSLEQYPKSEDDKMPLLFDDFAALAVMN